MADPVPQSFRLAIGQDKTLQITMDTPPAGGVAGWGLAFRLGSPGLTPVINITSGITVVDSVNGIWTIPITDIQSGVLVESVYEWSFWRTDSGQEFPIALGQCVAYSTE